MNKAKFQGNWNEVAGKLKQKYANLTDDDFLRKEGKDEELFGKDFRGGLGKPKNKYAN